MEQLKLALRKALFAGTTFCKHYQSISDIMDNMSDDELADFFSASEGNMQLLEDWDNMRIKMGIE